MIKLIKSAKVYSPTYEGIKDILICGDKIASIEEHIDVNITNVEVKIIDGKDKIVFPGFIDSHVHILGGGGEGSFKTRTPEIQLSTIVRAGVTSIVGCLGTDGVARSLKSLVAKAKALKEEGVSCYVYTGSYDIPLRTIYGEIKEDLMLIEEIIGVGEVAISDHRASAPTKYELAKIAAQARVGGMLAGKSGITNIHLGDSMNKLDMLFEIVKEFDIPIYQFLPTHINRNEYLFNDGIRYAKEGGLVDFTTSTIPLFLEEGEVKCSKALRIMLENGVNVENITFSSDGQGSLPIFDSEGNYEGVKVGDSTSLFEEVKDAILEENIPIETAIKVITSNPAKNLKLHNKGGLEAGMDADIVMVDKNTLEIDTVIAMGKIMMSNKEILVKGLFE